MRSDRGVTLIEVTMSIVLLGIMIPAIYASIMNFERTMSKSHELLQTYRVVQRSIEDSKFVSGPAGPDIIGDLPAGFSTAITEVGPVSGVADLKEYRVVVTQNGEQVLTYDFYWYVSPTP